MISTIIIAAFVIGGFTASSLLAGYLQRRRDAINAFHTAAEQAKRRPEHPSCGLHLRHVPLQTGHHPQGRHTK